MRSTALNVKSEYSPGSLVRIEALLDRVHELKMDTAGLADRATLLGIPHFLSAARRRGLHVLIGIELPIVSSVPEEAAAGITFPLIVRVAAQDSAGASAGLRALHRLAGRAATGRTPLGRVALDRVALDRAALDRRTGGIIAETGGGGGDRHAALTLEDCATELGSMNIGLVNTRAVPASSASSPSFELIAQSPGQIGEVSVRILRGQMDQAERLALRLTEVFGRSSVFAGISIHGGGGPDARGGERGRTRGRPTELELRLARETVALARRLGLSVAASNEVDHLQVQDAFARRLYDRIRAADAPGRGRVLPPDVPTEIRSGEEFEQLFRECPEALEGLDHLVARCRMLPDARVLEPLAGLLERRLDTAHAGGQAARAGRVAVDDEAVSADEAVFAGEVAAAQCLESRLAAGARTVDARARLRAEMGIIRREGLAVPLLLLERTFPGGQLGLDGATGSERIAWIPDAFLAGSWVAHRLGLTPVDPIRHRLPVRFPAEWLGGTAAGPASNDGAASHRAGFSTPVEVSPGRESDLDARLVALFGADAVVLPVRVERFDASSALFEVAVALGEGAGSTAPSAVSPALLDRAVAAARQLPRSAMFQAEAILAVFQNDPHLARAYHQDGRMQDWFDTARRIVGLPRRFNPDTGARFLAVHATCHLASGGPQIRPSVVDARPVARLTTEQTGFEPLLSLHLSSPPVRRERAEAHRLIELFQREQRQLIAESTNPKEVSMSLATRPARAGAEPSATLMPPSLADPLRLRVEGATGAIGSEKARTQAGGRFAPLAVYEREEALSVPSLRDATDAVALSHLSGRRASIAQVFAQRRAAGTPVDCGDESITRILAPTHGLLIYDEQVVDIAVRVAGFSALEAEEFRRALAGDIVSGAGEGAAYETAAYETAASEAVATAWRVRFVQGSVARGLTVSRAEGYLASLKQAAGGTVSRGACVAEAMRLLRESYGFGAVRDGRGSAGSTAGSAARAGAGRGRGIVPLRRRPGQLALPWLEPGEVAAAQPDEIDALRRRA